MTNFRKINLKKEVQVTGPKSTTFHSCVNSELNNERTDMNPEDYENVVYIGNDTSYGDVFIVLVCPGFD